MIDISKSKIEGLAKSYNLNLLVLFGSAARDDMHAKSDVDFGFLANKRMSPAQIAKMQFEFSKELKIKNLEFTDLKSAPPLLLRRVAEEAILLFKKEPSIFARLQIYAYKAFIEARSLLKLREEALDKFLQKN